MPIYLDYNATAPCFPEAAERLRELSLLPHNASSVHSYGREAKKHLEASRKTIAELVSAWANEVVFTASGTEANTLALRGTKATRVLVSAVEHSSVLKAREDATAIPVDSNGVVDLAQLDAMLDANTLVSVMLANNETGVIQPIAEIARLCRAKGALVHCDAVQGFGKIPVDFGALGVDMLTISGHKSGGPLGAAALIVRRELPLTPLFAGGQELGRRAGTENIAAIAGFALAAEKAQSLMGHMTQLRGWLDAMEASLTEQGGVVFGAGTARLPNTSCVGMPGVGNEVQLMDFDLNGFAVSAGSACSSGRIDSSHVLAAMGVEKELARTAIRVSAGWGTKKDEIDAFTAAWLKTSCRLSKTAVKAAANS